MLGLRLTRVILFPFVKAINPPFFEILNLDIDTMDRVGEYWI